MSWFGGLFGLHGSGVLGPSEIIVLSLVAVALMIEYAVPLDTQNVKFGMRQVAVPLQALLGVLSAATLLLMNQSSKFLYFQF
jgi:hypothetical protein